MLEQFEQIIREFISAHQSWAGPIVFFLAFGESLAFVSLLLPATAAMVFVGVLIGQGALDFWWIVMWAVPGAATGDWISFLIGRYFRETVTRIWPFTRHPEMLAQAHSFFHRWGVASVFLGRFLGPVRAVIPLVAGMMDMPRMRFQVANWTSATLWAPYWLGVGIFGDLAFTYLRQYVSGWGALAIIAGVIAAGWLAWRWFARRRGASS
ncbi:MAG: DedA family protein [Alphaproteobacteria bacterium]|nr:DedA family protein [Alphaproteobacteria bacterium]